MITTTGTPVRPSQGYENNHFEICVQIKIDMILFSYWVILVKHKTIYICLGIRQLWMQPYRHKQLLW